MVRFHRRYRGGLKIEKRHPGFADRTAISPHRSGITRTGIRVVRALRALGQGLDHGMFGHGDVTDSVDGCHQAGLGCDFGRLHDLVNQHRTLHLFLGHFSFSDDEYQGQTVIDNAQHPIRSTQVVFSWHK